MRIKITRKEAKEAQCWLKLIRGLSDTVNAEEKGLIEQAGQLRSIVSSIINKQTLKIGCRIISQLRLRIIFVLEF